MPNSPDPAHRQFGAAHPNHIRLFHEYRSAYWLNPAEPELSTPLDGYLAQEYARGYIVRSMVAVVNHPTKLRVVTEYDPKAAEKAAPPGHNGRPRSPMHIAVFQEDLHQYLADEGPHQGLTLDQYLADEKDRGYILKNAVGMVEDSHDPDPRRIRVTTELEHQPRGRAPARPDHTSATTGQTRSLQRAGR